jgi:hypothetical protein
MEIALRRLDGVADVSISTRTKLVEVTYKPGSSFQPQGIREAAVQAGATVVELRIIGRGRVAVDGSKRYFVAGKNRFLLIDSRSLPVDKPVLVTGTLDDSATPFKLKVLESKLAE